MNIRMRNYPRATWLQGWIVGVIHALIAIIACVATLLFTYWQSLPQAKTRAETDGFIRSVNYGGQGKNEPINVSLHTVFIDPDGHRNDVYVPAYVVNGRLQIPWQMLPASCDVYWDRQHQLCAIAQDDCVKAFL